MVFITKKSKQKPEKNEKYIKISYSYPMISEKIISHDLRNPMKSMGAQNPSRGDGDVFDLHLRLHSGRVEASVPGLNMVIGPWNSLTLRSKMVIFHFGSKPCSPFVHMKIAGIYGCELPTNIDNNTF